MDKDVVYSTLLAIAGAALFGASPPLSKLLLGEIEPVLLASFLYLGSGIGLFLYKMLKSLVFNDVIKEQIISRGDIPWLAGAILAGGIAAPIILMFSLRITPASTASLLLNFECVATTTIAMIAFGEILERRILGAILLITTAGIVLSADPGSQYGISIGAAGVLLACIFWGIDNNLMRNICNKDAADLGMIKGLCAGTFSLILAISLNNPFPSLPILLGALFIGSISYGLSIALFLTAMRGLGASRTSAWFAIAPFAGVVLSFLIFKESINIQFLVALPVMIIGAMLLFGEEHRHTHAHADIIHDHCHLPGDIYHKHEHDEDKTEK
ncbi:EamA family transporter [Methanocella sp. CWC-04]|uniref:EamA family transporter n=1 Tax=Methanooceanicella nereidis TaxID=2052831 RepID=A0AAP2RGL6_9EURY|nr:DMT family transporter [Methanocella sp. CWC-04]MCD1296255.1 EamA family transporter [Methanocella sp. CWC-04]